MRTAARRTPLVPTAAVSCCQGSSLGPKVRCGAEPQRSGRMRASNCGRGQGAGAVDGDDEFREFVAARWVSLNRLACLLTGTRADGKALLQQCLEKAYLRWPSIAEAGVPDAEVRKLMVHTLFAGWRRQVWRRQMLRRVGPDRTAEPLEPLEASLLDRELVWPIVCALPDRQRAVVVLRYYEGLGEREIADLLGCSVTAVRSRAHDAAAALRRGMLALQALGRIEDEP